MIYIRDFLPLEGKGGLTCNLACWDMFHLSLKTSCSLKRRRVFSFSHPNLKSFFIMLLMMFTWAKWRNLENVPMLYPSFWLGMILSFVLPFLITSRVEVVPHNSTEEAPLGNFSSKNFGIHCSLTQHQEADLKKWQHLRQYFWWKNPLLLDVPQGISIVIGCPAELIE